MLNKIKPFYSSKNTCIENLYIAICRALNKNSDNIYAYSWNFGYVPSETTFAKKITVSRDGQVLNVEQLSALREYCGIKMILHGNCNVKNFRNVVKKELEFGRPVALATDVYCCYWHLFGEKYHFKHYTLIVGIKDDGFVCVDDSLASHDGYLKLSTRPNNVTVSFETFEKYNFGYVTFEFENRETHVCGDKMVYLSALKTLNGFNNVSDFQNMRRLVHDMESDFDIEYEVGYKDDEKAKALPRTFSLLSWSRSNYFDFLSKLKGDFKLDMQLILRYMSESKTLWEEISNYILKFASTRKFDKFNKNVICNNLVKIISIEEETANYIVDKCEENFYGQI